MKLDELAAELVARNEPQTDRKHVLQQRLRALMIRAWLEDNGDG